MECCQAFQFSLLCFQAPSCSSAGEPLTSHALTYCASAARDWLLG